MALKPLRGTLSAEKLHTKALPKTAHAAFHRDLSAALASHFEKTINLLERLDRIVDRCGSKLKRMKRDALNGPRKKADHLIAEDTERPVGDTPLVKSLHKARHYATSTYALATFASHLDHPQAVELLETALDEDEKKEKAGDRNRSALAGQRARFKADTAPGRAGAEGESAHTVPAGNTHPL